MQDTATRTIPISDSRSLGTTQLYSLRVVDTNGQQIPIHSYTYYWFVGYSDITPSHMTRTMFDLRDRILHGYNQRWAYVTVASTVTQGITRPGDRKKKQRR